MRELKVNNVYGYPALSRRFLKWADAVDVDIVIATHNMEKAVREKEFCVILSGLPFLESAGVPILGYRHMASGMWVQQNLPLRLKENEVHLLLPKMSEFPSTDQLFDLFVNNVYEGLTPRFMRSFKQYCLNDRVFKAKHKYSSESIHKVVEKVVEKSNG